MIEESQGICLQRGIIVGNFGPKKSTSNVRYSNVGYSSLFNNVVVGLKEHIKLYLNRK